MKSSLEFHGVRSLGVIYSFYFLYQQFTECRYFWYNPYVSEWYQAILHRRPYEAVRTQLNKALEELDHLG